MVGGELGQPRVGDIDWDAPWFRGIADSGRAVAAEHDVRRALNVVASGRGIRNARQLPIRFAASDAAGAAAYEEHIARTGEVPTRDNLHDFFNALAWLTFPRTKARLNALQAEAIAAEGIAARRGPLRDAATLIDENGLLLVTQRSDLVDALAAHDWQALFIAGRAAWDDAIRPIVFGHALMEKLTAPYRGATAHALWVRLAADASVDAIDAAVAGALDSGLDPGLLLPLPVLGIPGWADNDGAAFYEDVSVFRPARAARVQDARSPGSRR